ncbi:Bicaudal D-related protein [Orchesella cincta]|uniref:Bicaudal D-related protein n=1 Tax=Orchesella cincta TaxID=48709 RepID=A0A1D2NI30_ORCCI|nr:Bicaudal D-related protein [Orchesella cincta]
MVSAMKQLEEYVIAMANRTEEADIHEQLMQKEKDLLLAAELGKALLEKNEELSRQNERITEEYTQKLEEKKWLDKCNFVKDDFILDITDLDVVDGCVV